VLGAFVLVVATMVVSGCNRHPDDPVSARNAGRVNSGLEVTAKRIRFAPRTATQGQGTIYIGLGSASIHLRGHEDGYCVFDYTFEIEGGYTTYRCRVPLSEPFVAIEALNNEEVSTSFDLTRCEIIKRGNVHEGTKRSSRRSKPSG